MAQPRGRRLLPTTIDQIAQDNPTRAWASRQPKGSSEFEDISISVFANAINRVAHWIIKTVGAPSSEAKKPVLAYIGPSDLRYYVLFVAIVKAGYVPLFMSHLNSPAANASLFASTGCRTLLCGFDSLDRVPVASGDLDVSYTPGVDEIWDATPVPAFPFTKSFDEAFDDPLLVRTGNLNVSSAFQTNCKEGRAHFGINGDAKTDHSMYAPAFVIRLAHHYTHGSYALYDTHQDIPDFEGHELDIALRARSSRIFVGLPPFHAAGLATGLQDSIFFETTIVFPPTDRPLSAKAVLDAIAYGRINGAGLLPHVLEELARSPEALQQLHKLEYIIWVGGPISQQAGDLISARTHLINAYASTEAGSGIALVKKDPSLWQYFFFHPTANGFDFRPVTGHSNLHELFVVKDPSLRQVVFRIFPELEEWPTKDLFAPHPTVPHHWRFEGRTDNLLVFQNGSKVNPLSVEAIVRRTPGVRDVLMFGNGRTRPGILVEPVDGDLLDEHNPTARSEFLDTVFPFVETSNRTGLNNRIVIRELLVLTTKGKPLPRASKGTVQRSIAFELYKKEIDALYEALPNHLRDASDYTIGSGSV